MARFAQRLPVAPIPEQLRIASVRNNVIDNGRGFQPAVLSAYHAQRILPQIQFSRGAPFGIVPTCCAAAANAVRGILPMQLAIDALVAGIRTPRKPAWTFGCMRHKISPFSAEDEHARYRYVSIMSSPLSSYTLPPFRFFIARSSAMTIATAPSIFSVDFSLSSLMLPEGSVRA